MKTLPKHPYLTDGTPADPLTGFGTCVCALPENHPRHEPTEQTAEAAELDARVLGEGGAE